MEIRAEEEEEEEAGRLGRAAGFTFPVPPFPAGGAPVGASVPAWIPTGNPPDCD